MAGDLHRGRPPEHVLSQLKRSVLLFSEVVTLRRPALRCREQGETLKPFNSRGANDRFVRRCRRRVPDETPELRCARQALTLLPCRFDRQQSAQTLSRSPENDRLTLLPSGVNTSEIPSASKVGRIVSSLTHQRHCVLGRCPLAFASFDNRAKPYREHSDGFVCFGSRCLGWGARL